MTYHDIITCWLIHVSKRATGMYMCITEEEVNRNNQTYLIVLDGVDSMGFTKEKKGAFPVISLHCGWFV